jgi:hypothetical protein
LKTVLFLKKTAGFPVRKSLEVLGLPSRTYHRWGVTQGKGKRPEGGLPKGHWILPEEREAILSFKRKHPSLGAKRLSFMMLDRNVVAISPSSVFRVWKAGRSLEQVDGFRRSESASDGLSSTHPGA